MTTTELSIEGAKESRSVIKQFHSCLNSLEVIPEQAYRRDKGAYPLVCYVNNIVGLFLSKNYEVIPIFIARAVEHMTFSPPSSVTSAYYEVVNRYLRQMAYHLRHFVSGIEHWDDRIPESLLNAGPQQVNCSSDERTPPNAL